MPAGSAAAPSRIAASRLVPWPGGAGGVAQLPVALELLVSGAARVAARERDDARPVPSARALELVGDRPDSAADPARETLAEVSASIATATLVSVDGEPRLRQRERDADERRRPSAAAPSRRAEDRHSHAAQASGSSASSSARDDRSSSPHLRACRADLRRSSTAAWRIAPRRKRPYRIHSASSPARPTSASHGQMSLEPSSTGGSAGSP